MKLKSLFRWRSAAGTHHARTRNPRCQAASERYDNPDKNRLASGIISVVSAVVGRGGGGCRDITGWDGDGIEIFSNHYLYCAVSRDGFTESAFMTCVRALFSGRSTGVFFSVVVAFVLSHPRTHGSVILRNIAIPRTPHRNNKCFTPASPGAVHRGRPFAIVSYIS